MIFYGKIVGIGEDFKKVKILSLQHEIPKQLSSVDEQLYLNRTSGILQSIVITLVTTNAGLTLIQSVGMQFVWGFLNAQQILSHVQLFNLHMPSNINYFYNLIQGSLKFQIYNALPITQFIFSIDQDDKPFNQAFADFGYDQTSLILNLDMLFYIYLLYPVLIVLYFLIDVLSAFIPRIQASKSKQFPSKIRAVACNYYTSMLVQIKPYDDKYQYLLEFFNEAIIFMLSELILIIEASPINEEGGQQIGWIYISIIGFCALSNFIFYLKVTGIKFFQRFLRPIYIKLKHLQTQSTINSTMPSNKSTMNLAQNTLSPLMMSQITMSQFIREGDSQTTMPSSVQPDALSMGTAPTISTLTLDEQISQALPKKKYKKSKFKKQKKSQRSQQNKNEAVNQNKTVKIDIFEFSENDLDKYIEEFQEINHYVQCHI
eukprot:403355975